MVLYIRTPCVPDIDSYTQVTQCTYHDERVIEIFWDNYQNCTVIQEFGQYFAITSPDVDNITISNVIEALGYSNQCINVTWTIDNSNDTLMHKNVSEAPLSQLSIGSTNNEKQKIETSDKIKNNNTQLNTKCYTTPAVAARTATTTVYEDEDRCYSSQ